MDNDGNTITIDQYSYQKVIRHFIALLKRRRIVTFGTQWFQQDGATPHTERSSLKFLKEKFGSRLISLKTELPWSPHSPDLSPSRLLSLGICGYAKDNVYKDGPRTLYDLRKAITSFIRRIPRQMCKDVIQNFISRLQHCQRRRGEHIEHIIS